MSLNYVHLLTLYRGLMATHSSRKITSNDFGLHIALYFLLVISFIFLFLDLIDIHFVKI